MTIIKLFFKDTEFLEEKKLLLPETELAILEINTETKEATLDFKPEIHFVDKKVAERQAQSICRTGFLLDSGERIGSGCNLIISS